MTVLPSRKGGERLRIAEIIRCNVCALLRVGAVGAGKWADPLMVKRKR